MNGQLRPDQDELLDLARSTFIEEILPVLPAHKRLTGLMIANALGIAQRLSTISLADGTDVVSLCADIRSGNRDDDDAGELRAHLMKRTLARLAVSSPKALPELERSLAATRES